MIAILDLLALALFAYVAMNIWRAIRRGQRSEVREMRRDRDGPIIEGSAEELRSPAAEAASSLRDFERARADLKQRYPATFAMLGGYLNTHTIAEHGGIEGAVREMIADWAARRDEARRELAKLLAENETEAEVRAIVTAACDAEFDREGYRAWLTWLLGRLTPPLSSGEGP